ncbi:choline/ethanolaminephosphotransferase 1 isoform X2 [Macrosteles quadrilineatus]|uniref:choline/ethanolaminephosphotransferase 1 isoform X2 n=1 Tax=Macrosteles quadrilineatus TaxID=74068 RepID=UPI0023E20576|nr:choline/ethanolaminephosphotransferase 1 isoform X2 [Macrosteles quadrilineatus]
MIFFKEKLLSAAQLKRLGEHKYKYDSCSLLDPYLQVYWNWLVSKVPIWLAPNLITILGLLVNILTTLLLVWFSPDAKSEAPRWAFLLCALGLFIYQSLDAIDGKQARRTDSSSPLGELFDHGCDSISTVFVALSACIAVQLGHCPAWMFFQCFCAVTLFYCAHWQTYVSGMLRFGRIDVTEAQFTIMFIHLISAVLGSEAWSNKVGFLDFIEIRFGVVLTTIVCGSISFYNIFRVIFTGGVGKNGSTVAMSFINLQYNQSFGAIFFLGYGKNFIDFCQRFQAGGAGKNGSSVAGTSVLSPVIPLSLVIVPAFIIWRKSEENLYENHPCLYVLAFGLVAAKVTNRLVVAHMTKNEMEYLDSSLFGPAMLFLNQYFNCFIPEYYVLWLCVIWVTLDLIRYSGQVCKEICDYLHIELFRIPVKEHATVHHTSKNGFS